jgi:hypothetical protein
VDTCIVRRCFAHLFPKNGNIVPRFVTSFCKFTYITLSCMKLCVCVWGGGDNTIFVSRKVVCVHSNGAGFCILKY